MLTFRRVSLRALLVTSILLSIPVGLLINKYKQLARQEQTVTALSRAGAKVYYDRTSRVGILDKAVRKICGLEARSVDTVLILSKPATLPDASLKQLQQLRTLRHLYLAGPHFTDDSLSQITNIRALQALTLSDTRITGTGIKVLSQVSSLRSLSLFGTSVNDDIIRAVGVLKNLQALQLRDATLVQDGLAVLGQLPELRHLLVANSPNLDVRMLSHLEEVNRLEELFLINVPVSDKALQYIAHHRHLRNVRLEGTQIRTLTGLSGLTQLESLSLLRNSITDSGFRNISDLRNIKQLSIGISDLSSESIDYITNLTGLQSLKLYPSNVSDSDLPRFGRLKNLHSFSVGPLVSVDAAEELTDVLPNCTVYLVSSGGYVEHRIKAPSRVKSSAH